MSQQATSRWESMRTDESRQVEQSLRHEFPRTDAYRYNSASIRVRVIDPRFAGKSNEERDDMVEPLIDRLPEHLQADIMNLLTLAPDEIDETTGTLKNRLANFEFEDPSPSEL